MNTHPMHRLTLRTRWIVGALILVFVSACALTKPAVPEPEGVNVGYGTADPESVTGSMTTIEPEEESGYRPVTLAQMIRGQDPGVIVTDLPGGGMRIRIRGTNSINSGEDPLFVLDGVALSSASSVGNLNPNDVQSITILKDAGSTAIYGSRGANGVILIRTKAGG